MKHFLTRKTHQRISEELTRLREVDLVAISREKLECAEQGDLRENFGYHEAKKKLEMIQNRIRQLTEIIMGTQFIDELAIPGNIVSLGTTIRVLDLENQQELQYHILGPEDADLKRDIISFQSPLARGLITKKAGDTVSVPIPDGTRKLKILQIEKYSFDS